MATTITATLTKSVMLIGSGDSWGVSVGTSVGDGVGVWIGLDVGVTSGDGAGVGVGDAVGVGVGVVGGGGMMIWEGIEGAEGLGVFRYGMKFNVPKLLAFLWSHIVWLISEASVVPHQLLAP